MAGFDTECGFFGSLHLSQGGTLRVVQCKWFQATVELVHRTFKACFVDRSRRPNVLDQRLDEVTHFTIHIDVDQRWHLRQFLLQIGE